MFVFLAESPWPHFITISPWALVCVAIHPYQIFSVRVPGLVVTLTLMVLLVAVALARFLNDRKGSTAILGVVWGGAALTHAPLLPIVAPMAVIMFFLQTGSWGRGAFRIAGVTLIICLCVAPWTLRNYHAFQTFIPVSTEGGLQYWLGQYIYFKGYDSTSRAFEAIQTDFKSLHQQELEIRHGGAVQHKQDQLLLKEGAAQFRGDLWLLPRRALVGPVLFWTTKDRGMKKAFFLGMMNLPLVAGLVFPGTASVFAAIWCRAAVGVLFLFLGVYGLFELIQGLGPYFVVVTPPAVSLLFYTIHCLARQNQQPLPSPPQSC